MPMDNSAANSSSGGYSTSTFVTETVSSSSLPALGSGLGEETWSEAGGAMFDDASAVAGDSLLLGLRQETAKEKAAPAAPPRAGGGDAWHTEATTGALYEKQSATTRRALPGLIADARVFASRLTHLAGGQGLDGGGDSSS